MFATYGRLNKYLLCVCVFVREWASLFGWHANHHHHRSKMNSLRSDYVDDRQRSPTLRIVHGGNRGTTDKEINSKRNRDGPGTNKKSTNGSTGFHLLPSFRVGRHLFWRNHLRTCCIRFLLHCLILPIMRLFKPALFVNLRGRRKMGADLFIPKNNEITRHQVALR